MPTTDASEPEPEFHVAEDAPPDRCGFTAEYPDDGFPADATCWRETWRDADRCVWHAPVDGKPLDALPAHRRASSVTVATRLDGAYLAAVEGGEPVQLAGCTLVGADLSGSFLAAGDFARADLRAADLSGAELGSADLAGATLHDVDLADATLQDADLAAADLWQARLSDADLRDADLSGATLRKADLTDADLRGADLSDADLFDVDLAGAYLRRASMAGAVLDYPTVDWERVVFDDSTTFGVGSAEHLGQWASAAREYRAFQQDLREQALPGKVVTFRVREKHARRRAAIDDRDVVTWAKLALQRWTALYGESPYRVVYASVALIVGSALLYPRFGLLSTKAGETTALLSYANAAPGEGLYLLGKSLYFSVVTFTTVGYGDLQPTTGAAELLATVESFLGALLMALLVFVLGRRATW